ncbi:DUF2087 domain-containing protein [Paenibacillus sp. FSL H7-0331]|uniref:DUF2087 domain-containing protein n=1 Tax=Paenibacillus sp. FSL H7-0331 TaxID=1920421 RepID=UPI00096D8D34|nr:DUF2087 domain-containing protein [Paenibacillus sp. FSL H7-0331]OMF18183.1 hypothetical protein BK127_10355 [Paenibacillus sp. FSL H7-0331]
MYESDLLWRVPLEELKRGYTWDESTDTFICLICGDQFQKGMIYRADDLYYEAEKFTTLHIANEHGTMFHYLIGLNKKLTGLSDLQKNLLQLFYEGHSDNEIVSKLDGGSASTIRNHRFALREKEKQARLFVAIMDLLEKKNGSGSKKSERTSRQHAGAVHRTVAVRDNNFSITDKEYQDTILKYFIEGPDGPIISFPGKEKKKFIVLQHIVSRFKAGRRYTEKEVNAQLEQVYADYVTLRRYMIEYELMDREPDGSAYWIKEEVTPMSKEKRKELLLAYKETKRPMGIYQIRNTVNGKIFIGSSRNLDGRWNRHQFELGMGMERNKAFESEWKELGDKQFAFETLELLEERMEGYQDIDQELETMLAKWIEKLQPFGERGYNLL